MSLPEFTYFYLGIMAALFLLSPFIYWIVRWIARGDLKYLEDEMDAVRRERNKLEHEINELKRQKTGAEALLAIGKFLETPS